MTYHATLCNNQLTTPAPDGEKFTTPIDGPGIYRVNTYRVIDGEDVFGVGKVEITAEHLKNANTFWRIFPPVIDHKIVHLELLSGGGFYITFV